MTDIEIGDKIKCVYAGHEHHELFFNEYLTFGKIYEVNGVSISRFKEPLIDIILDNGRLDSVLLIYKNEVWFEVIKKKEIDYLEILKGY